MLPPYVEHPRGQLLMSSVSIASVLGSLTFGCVSSGVSRTETCAVSVVLRCNPMDTENELTMDGMMHHRAGGHTQTFTNSQRFLPKRAGLG
jgi:hypothetical protein